MSFVLYNVDIWSDKISWRGQISDSLNVNVNYANRSAATDEQRLENIHSGDT